MSITGKYLTAMVSAAPIAGTHEWSANETGDRLEATTGADNGRGRKHVGVIDSRFRIRFYFDITTGAANFIRTGTTLSDLALFADKDADTPIYLIESATVFDFNIAGQVRDRFIVDADIEANGDVIDFSDGN
ncbi:hypothetical protein VT84_24390 [Gemmata sp. SH-PL17]|uniref:hypothetical protein n=1 Tax=Gemmata sp. SH-PL17 TaxID=1630693 RepID=UPI0004B93148|nr:hypothetical protein [Gemmata sp. SH-PL17]AMV27563.1 hypothetical protein VT84_24390 [Gemmata sp. SH-PL17]